MFSELEKTPIFPKFVEKITKIDHQMKGTVSGFEPSLFELVFALVGS